METLTDREREIMALLSTGWTPKAIARALGLRPVTVRRHLFRARKRTGCTTIIELAVKIATERSGE